MILRRWALRNRFTDRIQVTFATRAGAVRYQSREETLPGYPHGVPRASYLSLERLPRITADEALINVSRALMFWPFAAVIAAGDLRRRLTRRTR